MDKLEMIKAEAKRLRDLRHEIRDLEARTKDLGEEVRLIEHEILPRMLDDAGIPTFTVAADGNMPATTFEVRPYFKAVVAAGWPREKRKAALDWLDANGHGVLIKTQLTVVFDREDRADALAAADYLRSLYDGKVEVKEDVHWMTLTSWVKEMMTEHNKTPPLELLGAEAGRVVKVTEE